VGIFFGLFTLLEKSAWISGNFIGKMYYVKREIWELGDDGRLTRKHDTVSSLD
jgi:hypothetical protein